MKKSILIIALISITTISFAQTAKKDTVKNTVKPAVTYQADPNRVYDLQLHLTSEQLFYFTMPDADLQASDKLSGKQITDIEDFKKDTRKDLVKQANELAKNDWLKFKADTAAHKK